jgi:secretion/DNA translocation related CpaE-like protein
VPPADLAGALPAVDSLHVLSWDRGDVLEVGPEAMESVLRAAAQTADLVVVDLPRRPDESSRVALRQARRTFLVVPAELRAVTAAARTAALVGPLTPSLQLVVRGPAPGGLDAQVVAEAVGLPLAGHCRPEPRLAEALERGLPPGGRRGPLAALADQLVRDVLVMAGGA